jgi:hypothetical protein
MVNDRFAREEKAAAEEAKRLALEQEKKEREEFARSGRKPLSAAWVEYLDKKTKKPFYYNTVTRKSTWEKPREFKVDKKRLIKEVTFGMHFYH